MNRRRPLSVVVLTLTVGWATGGCQIGEPPGPAGQAAATAQSPSASVAASATTRPPTSAGTSADALPSLCRAAKPPSRDPFPYNRDAQRRDALVRSAQQVSVPGTMTYIGGVAQFAWIDVATVAELITDNYLDPDERQNEAPTSWEIFQFLCRYPTVFASGYLVSVDRDDYRVTLDDIGTTDLTPRLRADAAAFCAAAETTTVSSLECFWD